MPAGPARIAGSPRISGPGRLRFCGCGGKLAERGQRKNESQDEREYIRYGLRRVNGKRISARYDTGQEIQQGNIKDALPCNGYDERGAIAANVLHEHGGKGVYPHQGKTDALEAQDGRRGCGDLRIFGKKRYDAPRAKKDRRVGK